MIDPMIFTRIRRGIPVAANRLESRSSGAAGATGGALHLQGGVAALLADHNAELGFVVQSAAICMRAPRPGPPSPSCTAHSSQSQSGQLAESDSCCLLGPAGNSGPSRGKTQNFENRSLAAAKSRESPGLSASSSPVMFGRQMSPRWQFSVAVVFIKITGYFGSAMPRSGSCVCTHGAAAAKTSTTRLRGGGARRTQVTETGYGAEPPHSLHPPRSASCS
jgi:hypothetical protein